MKTMYIHPRDKPSAENGPKVYQGRKSEIKRTKEAMDVMRSTCDQRFMSNEKDDPAALAAGVEGCGVYPALGAAAGAS
jgi:hypothetical protein